MFCWFEDCGENLDTIMNSFKQEFYAKTDDV